MTKYVHTLTQIAKHKRNLCITPYCKKKPHKKEYQCSSCRTNKYRAKHPLFYAYKTLKYNAKRRKKEFSLTFKQFENFAKKNKYMNKKGTRAKSFTIDRIDETKGYHFDNIQCITLRENIHKYQRSKINQSTLAQEAGF